MKTAPEHTPLRLQSLRVENFKTISDSSTEHIGALTAFVGHNGSGKTSLNEAMETYQSILVDGLDVAMRRWIGIEYARHLGAEAKERVSDHAIKACLSTPAHPYTGVARVRRPDAVPQPKPAMINHFKNARGWVYDDKVDALRVLRAAEIDANRLRRSPSFARFELKLNTDA